MLGGIFVLGVLFGHWAVGRGYDFVDDFGFKLGYSFLLWFVGLCIVVWHRVVRMSSIATIRLDCEVCQLHRELSARVWKARVIKSATEPWRVSWYAYSTHLSGSSGLKTSASRASWNSEQAGEPRSRRPRHHTTRGSTAEPGNPSTSDCRAKLTGDL